MAEPTPEASPKVRGWFLLGTVLFFFAIVGLASYGFSFFCRYSFQYVGWESYRQECPLGQKPQEVTSDLWIEKCCSWDKALYFGTQTATTVGYGAGVSLQTKGLHLIAVVSCLLGALAFGLVVSALFWLCQGILAWFENRSSDDRTEQRTNHAG